MTTICTRSSLPEDLVIEILLRLPVKSLLRFRIVCKQWHVIIKSPSFIRKHVYHWSNYTRLLVYYHANMPRKIPKVEFYDFTLFQDETLETYEEPPNLKLPGLIEALHGPCNGIFCVLSTSFKLALWNPATRRMRGLPSPSKEFIVIDEIGFGIDPITDEFKIVLIIGHNCVCRLEPFYAVYTSSNDSWKYYKDEVHLNDHSIVSRSEYGTTFLNGFYYWKKYSIKTFSSVILTFDMHNEVFRDIEMPEVVRSIPDGNLGTYNDSLALFSYDINAFDRRIDIWVMKEKGCWMNLLTCVLPLKSFVPLGFWKGKQIFATTLVNSIMKLMMYDPDLHNIRNIRAEKREIVSTLKVWPVYYKESLVSIETDGIPDYDIQSEVIRKFLVRRWGPEFDPE
ncbi:hypothetical protein RD792_005989 [Penstemon davidsonii]|uniref:F-box domain-containing protein n=1 Tax=Penstemon davidsonii TaxID=160366 RepID=A0ABR0DDS3_9LAMI|nr:hypothetical protein RD792_005989 [Penstemon davidsonii]